jgi:hypothetical protein
MTKKLHAVSAKPAHTASWHIRFFQRHRDDDPGQRVPGRDYLDDCPVAARILAVPRTTIS